PLPELRVAEILFGTATDDGDGPDSRGAIAEDAGNVDEEEAQAVSVPVSGAQVVSMEDLVEALSSLGGDTTPEDLYTRLGLSEAGIDSFYIALRAAVAAGKVRQQLATGVERSRLVQVQS